MLNGRLYRACIVPLLVALTIAGFSLSAPGGSLGSALAPDAFDGPAAFAELKSLAARFPERRPGSPGDEALAAEVARKLEGLGGSAAGGFSVATRRFSAATIDGRRTLTTVIARRPGLSGASPIVLLAHRDAAARGRQALAELSGTAVLLELARVLATSETRRTVIVLSTSGGSGGDAGAADFAAHPGGPIDAAIALGDVAGADARKPFVLSYADGLGAAPALLVRTLSGAISQEVGVNPGTAPDTLSRLAHLALPLTPGEQGPLLAQGLPAVALQVSGERGPTPGDPVSATRLENFGRAALSAIYALDAGPDLPAAVERGLPIQRKMLPEWAVRLLLLALLLPPLVVLVDGLARLRRRHVMGKADGPGSPASGRLHHPLVGMAEGPAGSPASGRLRDPAAPLARAFLWALACALPFLIAALFTRLLGLLGILGAPAGLVLPEALPAGATALESVLAPLLVLALAWLAWPALMRRLKLPAFDLRAAGSGALGIALMLVLLAVTLVVWLFNPYAALLLVPALHLWLAVIDPDWRLAGPALHRVRALALLALGVLPLALLVALYAHQLGYGPGSLLHAAVLLLAGGYLGIPAILMWCLAFGCLSAATLVALSPAPPLLSGAEAEMPEGTPITVRGPMSYAGPGSLGGTESALRR